MGCIYHHCSVSITSSMESCTNKDSTGSRTGHHWLKCKPKTQVLGLGGGQRQGGLPIATTTHALHNSSLFLVPQLTCILWRPLYPPPRKGCNRNKSHKRFRPLKSAVCVKNHFKRSHCPKMYSCNRCNKKSFSVVSDLKSHLKHCGESRWRAVLVWTSFSRKDKLFGHVALFEGHMPAIVGEEKSMRVDLEDEMEVDREDHVGTADTESSNSGFFEGLLEGFGAMDESSLNDWLGFL